MRFPMTVLRAVTLGPALLVSLVLTVVVCAVLPPALGLVAFMAAGGVLVALAMGQLPEPAIAATQDLTLFLLLRAFASGCTALTGIEAISDGVPAFKVKMGSHKGNLALQVIEPIERR